RSFCGVCDTTPIFSLSRLIQRLCSKFTCKGPKTNLHLLKCSASLFGRSCAVSSVVEHFLDTEGVRGSNPLSRTILPIVLRPQLHCSLCCPRGGTQLRCGTRLPSSTQ